MKDQGDSYPNDRVYMFGKTIDAAGLIWLAPQGSGGTGAQGSSVLTSWLTQSAITRLNNLMCSSPPGGYWINITAQDDHEIDYVKLSIWYY